MNEMKTILVVGGMGAGKSSVTRALASQGAAVVDLDALGHDALLQNSVKCQIKHAFRCNVFNGADEIDRTALANVAFENAAATATLNSITQPCIMGMLLTTLEQLSHAGCRVAVIEASSFTGQVELVKLANYIVYVKASEHLRIARVIASGWREDDVRARMAHQLSDAEFERFANVTFENNGSPEQLREQVFSWYKRVAEPSAPADAPTRTDTPTRTAATHNADAPTNMGGSQQ